MDIEKLEYSENIAEMLDSEELGKIGQQVLRNFEIDEDSRSDWLEIIEKAMKIAKQTLEAKNHPFENASNVKYPLITKAAIDFASRTYPEIVRNNKVVKAVATGRDPEGEKLKRSVRVAEYMSYQLMKESDEWEDELDKLLHILPLLGTVFKKTYYNPVTDNIVSELCKPDKIVVNYNIKSIETARRISHILCFHINDIIERIRSGIYRDIDLDLLKAPDDLEGDDAPVDLIEQHCFLDLDEDGYKEPYVVTVHRDTGEVLRIVSRFKEVVQNEKKEIIRIEPIHYFTDFHFIKSPDGGFYSVGLGSLLYPINAAINTLVNQLIDAGTLNNSQGGFLGRGLRLKNGDFKLKLGEWKVVEAATGSNLQQNIVPLPTKEPSQTLFSLLGLLIDIGRDLVSSTDVMQGKGQTQNVASTTIDAMIEQGMKIFYSIHKRLYRSLKKEYKKIYKLNSLYLDNEKYRSVLDSEEADVFVDFSLTDYDICPVADPSTSTEALRVAKAQALMQLPTVNAYEASKYYLETLGLEEELIERLLPAPDPNQPPPPESLKLMAEVEKLKAEAQAKNLESKSLVEGIKLDAIKLQLQQADTKARTEESAARIVKMQADAATNAAKIDLAEAKAGIEVQEGIKENTHTREKDAIEMAIKAKEAQVKADKVKVDKAKVVVEANRDRDNGSN